MSKINNTLTDLADQATHHLSTLQAQLQPSEVVTWLQSGQMPRLLIRKPEPGAPQLAIYAAPAKPLNGRRQWWFWWRPGEQIARVEEMDEAVKKIELHLGVGEASS